MSRVAIIVATFVALVGAAAVATYRMGGETARQAGVALYLHRFSSTQRLRQLAPYPPILWLSDSTTMAAEGYPSYVPMVHARLGLPNRPPLPILDGPGLDAYAYWSLAGQVAALRPRLVVMIANLRNFGGEGGPRGFNDVTGELELADLPRTLMLPYWIRGMTAPRLLLARMLRTELGEDVFLTLEGVRRDAQDAPAWTTLGPAERPATAAERFVRYGAAMDRLLAQYDRPITPVSPLVQFAGATVGRLVREGIPVLVIVTPFAWEGAAPKHYEEARFRARVAVLRSAVEANGGELVDFHRALGRDAFRDRDCHFTRAGAATMANLVAPEIRKRLAAAPPGGTVAR